MEKRNIIILGAKGQLGSELVRECQAKSDWMVHPFSHDKVDVTRTETLQSLFKKNPPSIVLNCTAYNQVETAQSEPDRAFAINTGAVAALAMLCQQIDALFVHFSTDYVFDGEKDRPYIEEDTVVPINIYGLSKAAGEKAVRILHPKHCIIRTCGLYGTSHSPRAKRNFVEAILTKAKEKAPIQVRDDSICTPTSASELASATFKLLEKNATGTFHITNEGSCSWFEFACEILKIMGTSHEVLPLQNPTAIYKTPRPRYTVLDNSKIKKYGIQLSSWQVALADYLKKRSSL